MTLLLGGCVTSSLREVRARHHVWAVLKIDSTSPLKEIGFGYTVELIKQVGGNLQTVDIRPKDF